MKMRTLTGILAASALTLLSGAALSDALTISTTVNQLVDYDEQTGVLTGLPAGQNATAYQNGPQTVQLPANLGAYEPPDPCLPLATAWNLAIEHQTGHRPERRTFDALLTAMSLFSCSASITSVTNISSPYPLVQIQPTN